MYGKKGSHTVILLITADQLEVHVHKDRVVQAGEPTLQPTTNSLALRGNDKQRS
jgi:hypothetical protein